MVSPTHSSHACLPAHRESGASTLLQQLLFLFPLAHFLSQHSCLSRSRPLPGDGCPLSCWGPCPLNLSTVVPTSQPWLLLSAGFFFFPNLSQMPLWAQWLSLESLRVKCFSREMERKEPPQRCLFQTSLETAKKKECQLRGSLCSMNKTQAFIPG